MSVIFREISYIEFSELDCAVLFHEEKTARRFGVITNGIFKFKFSWQSENINPIVKGCINSVYYLGIDLMFSIIKFGEETFRSVVKLDYFLYDIILIKGWICVITELEILVIDASCYEIVKRISLPSLFKEINSESPLLAVECMEGESVNIEIP